VVIVVEVVLVAGSSSSSSSSTNTNSSGSHGCRDGSGGAETGSDSGGVSTYTTHY
jgi:hypothetical protein